MVDATARYIIAAEDRTKATLATIKGGFQNLDQGIKSTLRGLSLAFGLFLGVQVKQAFQRVIRAASVSNKEFAASVDGVRAAFQNLMVPKAGMPAAVESMKELAATLKDPAVIEAADQLTSAMIRGFANAAIAIGYVAKGFKGWQVMLGLTGDEVENINNQIEALNNKIAALKALSGGRADTSSYERLRDQLAQQQMGLNEAPRVSAVAGPDMHARMDAAGAAAGSRASRRFNVMQEFGENVKWLDDLEKFDSQRREIMKEASEDLEKLNEESFQTELYRNMEGFDKRMEMEAALATFRKDSARQAAMESAAYWKDFFKDAFTTMALTGELSFRKLGQALIANLLNRQVLKMIDTLFASFGSGGGGSSGGGFWSSVVGAIGGMFRAEGGPVTAHRGYIVGERGPELFTPRQSGVISPAGAMAGGGSITIQNYNTFHAGSDAELRATLPRALQNQSNATIARLKDMKRRGEF